ncbi:hypothetical protein TWF192_011082 [Orbilia oligospora]|uniref:SCP domain-containing protein n=2 Tax=Orbilia oligospora TaxID=2813651 RepID=A0A6G1MHN4_ORBOL|nr:hypothetical protein TWF191_003589 [Orbilia oligospora]KAF3258947.1 hypothetical protein TWF192_011082 [Orbilia oligospora]
MRFSTIISVGLVVTSALAVPVQQAEGKSTTVQYERDPSKRSSFRELLQKRKQCNKGKTRASTIGSTTRTITLASYETSPTPAGYEVPTDYLAPNGQTSRPSKNTYTTSNGFGGRRNRGGRKNGASKNNSTTTPTTTDDETSTGGDSGYQSSSPSPSLSNSPSYEYDTPTSYLTMPAGSSTGLERGSSVRNVGPDGTFMSESAIKPYLLAAHNIVRSLHEGAGPITWDSSIAKLAEENTPNCDFAHTPSAKRKGLGENISYNTNGNPEDQALRQWYANEVVNYNFDNPSNSDGVIGHMTAMVWKDVKSFGCAVRNCGSHGMGLYLKCNYSPVPNIIGRYDQQVGRVKGASTEAQIRKIVEAATGFAPR